jgi:hypothetical protein
MTQIHQQCDSLHNVGVMGSDYNAGQNGIEQTSYGKNRVM